MSVYNDPQGMLRSLDSVFCDEPLADILIVDDGSAWPLTLPSAPPDFSITLLRLDKNSVIVGALNAGLEWILARSYPYVARLDAGDRVAKGRLAAQVAYLENNPRVGVLGTQMRAVDPASDTVLFTIRNPLGPADARKTLYTRNVIGQPSAMIRAQALRDCGLYNPTYRYAEDYELWRRIARRYDIANLPQFYIDKEISPVQMTALYRRRGIVARLRTQIRYFNVFSPHAWWGIGRSLLSLLVSRPRLIAWRLRQAAA